MFSKMKLSTKIWTVMTGCLIIPIVVVIVITHRSNGSVEALVKNEIKQMAHDHLTDVVIGIYNMVDEANRASVKSNCTAMVQNVKNRITSIYESYKKGEMTEQEAKDQAAGYLLSQAVGETGYAYVLSTTGAFLVHPNSELVGQNVSQYDFIGRQLALNGPGYIEYEWKNPGETEARSKSLAQELFEPWGWIIAVTAYNEEFYKIVKRQVEESVKDRIASIEIGQSGYAYVVGGKGDDKGHYIVSFQRKRDGENIWSAKDSDGRFFIQSIIGQAVSLEPGQTASITYPWKNPNDAVARPKMVEIAYFEPWDWVIGAGAYQDELEAAVIKSSEKFRSAMYQILLAGLLLLVAGMAVATFLVRGITRPINRIIEALASGSREVSSASTQVSAASQSLAEGASEQAAAIEETSASLEEMSSMTKQNADNSSQANSLMREAKTVVDKAGISMKQVNESMDDISSSGQEIGKIIKTIDEIAFQTNLLALNAAVEAARAGEAGAGFAVVADEVRNLAQRAAEAAKNTANLIEGTITRINQGTDLVKATDDAFSEVARSSGKVAELIGEIAAASTEQAQGIDQVNQAVTQMDQVTQSNAASAEESASASAELNAQAESMLDVVGELIVLVGGLGAVEKMKAEHPVQKKAAPKRKALPRPAQYQQPEKNKKSRQVNAEKMIPMDDDFDDF